MCQFLAIFQEAINLWFIGRLDDLTLINAMGLGNAIMNVLGYATVFGLNGALATFVSQKVGAGQFEMCGVLRWKARYLVSAALVLLLPVYLFSKSIFLALGMDEEASVSGGRYLKS